MKHLRHFFLVMLFALVLVRPGNGCSFPDDDGVPTHIDPDKPYASFVAGKLGVISGELRVRHMVIAYNTLSGRGLTPAEQKAAIDVDRFYNYGGGIAPETPSTWFGETPTPRAGATAWFKMVPDTSTGTEHTVPGSDYQSFTNCLDDAYIHAAKTLAERRKQYGKPVATDTDTAAGDTPDIKDWIAGQRAVFSNCSNMPSQPTFGPDGHPAKPAPPSAIPSPAAANAPIWLKQDRAYQIAAAQFYALDYDHALSGFRAIVADKASPWSQLSRYVAARVLIRKATVPYRFASSTPAQADAENARVAAGLSEARDQLQAIVRDPSMNQYHQPAQHLLDYVMIRVDPVTQTEELARRLTLPAKRTAMADPSLDLDYRQNVIDLTFAYNSMPLYTNLVRSKGHAPIEPKAPLLRWINDLYGDKSMEEGLSINSAFDRDPAHHQQEALAAWQNTHEPQWLATALTVAEPGGEGVAEMIAAAKAVPASSPAYASVTYHRLRLEAATAASPGRAPYGELAALMPEIERTQPRSTINLFADLHSRVVPTLDLFLKSATRVTPVSIQAEPGEGFETPATSPGNASGVISEMLCGVAVPAPETRHLDTETALIFNQRMPLNLLRDSALSPALPANVRFQVAHAAWTRALLLNDPVIARALSPYLAQCQPAIKTWLDQYNAAKTADEHHVLGLLAMMRFTSTEPVVRVGLERDFASYDEMRDNWWCNAGEGAYVDPKAPPKSKPAALFSQILVPRATQPDPPFLTDTDRAAMQREIATLEKIPGASDYFAQQALDWFQAHPDDPHNADVLGFAMRVVRNACRSDDTRELNHQLFDVLHKHYPKSEWAMRYKTWE